MKQYFWILALPFLLFGCEKTETENQMIVNLAYDMYYSYPEGFYNDHPNTESVYYLKNHQIFPDYQPDTLWIELSTDSRDTAFMWLKTYINEDRWDYLYEEETEKYHELKCTSAISKNRYRVHKTSYYRSIFNHFAPLSNDYEIGYYNGAIEKDKVQECVEYLWTIHAFNSHNQKVINIEITEKEDYFEVYTYSLALIYGDWDMQDIIDVYDNYIRFDKNSKLISFRKSLRKQIMTNR